jgi:hypothetical protein
MEEYAGVIRTRKPLASDISSFLDGLHRLTNAILMK